jgi:hypothetical protein
LGAIDTAIPELISQPAVQACITGVAGHETERRFVRTHEVEVRLAVKRRRYGCPSVENALDCFEPLEPEAASCGNCPKIRAKRGGRPLR